MDTSEARVLGEAIVKVRNRILQTRERSEHIGEQDTKAILIDPVLSALGWQLQELDEVRREYRRKPQDNPVDYALLVLRKPRLFIEAKALGTALDHRKCARQVLGYASVVGVGWCVVTNGDEYRLYNSHAAVDVEDKLFRMVRISDSAQTEFAVETLGLLRKETLGENLLETLWKSQFVDRRVRFALEDVFLGDDAGLSRLMRKRLPELSPSEIRDSLRRASVRIDFPMITPDSLAQGRGPAAEVVDFTEAPLERSPRSVAAFGVTVADLIGAGLIRPPLRLERKYRGVELEATVELDGSVRLGDQICSSLSTAGGLARKSVIGTSDGRPYPQTNGWTFWQYRDEDTGGVHPISKLRQRFLGDGS